MSRFSRLRKKFKYAFRGLYIAFTSDNSFKIHFGVAIPVIILGFLLSFNPYEWIVIIFCIGLVLISELFNTAIEFLVRMFTGEYHKLAEKLLDISAGAVLLSSIISILLGLIIFIPHFIRTV
ncbi:MAG: diacylglycerol kinase family protein [Spirochaetales bacterium]|nr:diacylglycerol kinase family protein [Spirochaetales bacterium]